MTDGYLYQCGMTTDEEHAAYDRLLNPPERQQKPFTEPLAWRCECCGGDGPFDGDGCDCQEAQ